MNDHYFEAFEKLVAEKKQTKTKTNKNKNKQKKTGKIL